MIWCCSLNLNWLELFLLVLNIQWKLCLLQVFSFCKRITTCCNACNLLQLPCHSQVGALEGDEQLTPLGHHLAKLPVDVLIGKVFIKNFLYLLYCRPPPPKKKKKKKQKRKLTKHPGLNPRVIIFGSTVLVRHSLVQQCQEVVGASVLFRSSYLVYCVRFFCLKVSACLWEVLIFRFCIITNFFNLGSSSHFWNWNGHQRRIQGVPPHPPSLNFI